MEDASLWMGRSKSFWGPGNRNLKEVTVGPVLEVVLFGKKKELWKGEEVFRVSRRKDQEKRCLVDNSSGREGDGVAGW